METSSIFVFLRTVNARAVLQEIVTTTVAFFRVAGRCTHQFVEKYSASFPSGTKQQVV